MQNVMEQNVLFCEGISPVKKKTFKYQLHINKSYLTFIISTLQQAKYVHRNSVFYTYVHVLLTSFHNFTHINLQILSGKLDYFNKIYAKIP